MEIKSAKVTQATANGTWESKYGLMYRHEISFDNGDIGEYSSKSANQDKFLVGQETSYEAHTREYNGKHYLTVKPVQQDKPMGGGFKKDPQTEKRITRMNVLQRAVDMYLHERIDQEEILVYAEMFEKWVNGDAVNMPSGMVGSTKLPF